MVFVVLIERFMARSMPEPGAAEANRVQLLVAFAVILIPPVIWLASRGLDTSNLSAAADIWFGTIAGLAAFRFRRLRFLVAISSTLLFLGALEVAAHFNESMIAPPPKVYSYTGEPPLGWMAEHGLVGYAFMGPARLWASATKGDEILFDSVFYSIDPLSRRTCNFVSEPPQHALFFGGSFAFGEGLSNAQMIACQFQTASGNEYQGYNYGMMGWGASQTFNQLGVDELFEDIQQRSGIAVFCFIGDHIYRTTWNIGTAAEYPEYPFFRLSDGDDLVGPFKARDQLYLQIAANAFGFMRGYSPIFRTMAKPSMFRIESDEDAVKTTARVLGAARLRYRNRFDGEFIVLLWPRSRLDPVLEERFVQELTALGVPVIHVPELPGKSTDAFLHPKDHHPSSKEITWVARSLFSEILALN
jgi:hypothetical protein